MFPGGLEGRSTPPASAPCAPWLCPSKPDTSHRSGRARRAGLEGNVGRFFLPDPECWIHAKGDSVSGHRGYRNCLGLDAACRGPEIPGRMGSGTPPEEGTPWKISSWDGGVGSNAQDWTDTGLSYCGLAGVRSISSTSVPQPAKCLGSRKRLTILRVVVVTSLSKLFSSVELI